MNELDIYRDIRPYKDAEVPEVIERLLKEPMLYQLMDHVYPNLSEADVSEMFREVKSVNDFQESISGPIFKVITQHTTSGLTFSNIDNLEKGKAYLFLSNHRDIILDSALLNVSLLEMGYETTQIAIGSNLLQHRFVEDLVRLNKNFIVNRNAGPKEMLANSKHLSNYIRKTIVDDHCGVWIAHKEGRSKDGDDRTAAGLLKMLTVSSNEALPEALKALNIIPTVVSYEYDPCDLYKANELMALKQYGAYKKQEGEDYKSMLKGLLGHKGRVNIAVGSLMTEAIDGLSGISNKNDFLKQLSLLVDKEMHELYKLWPTNYIAHDLLNGTKDYKAYYTSIQRITFRNYIRGRVLKMMMARKKLGHQKEGFMKQVRETLLQMYANPVINREKADQI